MKLSLDDLLPLPEWHKSAACRGHPDPEVFYPAQGDPGTEARTTCEACPVRSECLDAALSIPATQDFGIWGGTTAPQRRRMRKQARGAA